MRRLGLGLILLALTGTGCSTYYVRATGGSDSNPCTEAQPCASFERAYNVASDPEGNVVDVGPGVYPAQHLPEGNKPIVYKGADGAVVRNFNGNQITSTLEIDADGAAIVNIDVDANAARRIALGWDSVAGGLYKDGTVRNSRDHWGVHWSGSDIRMENSVVRDVVLADPQAHIECIRATEAERPVLLNTVFANCSTMDVMWTTCQCGPAPGQRGRIEGNTFGTPVGGVAPYSVVWHGQSYPEVRDWVVRNNSFGSDIAQPQPWVGANAVRCGNTGPIGAEWKAPC